MIGDYYRREWHCAKRLKSIHYALFCKRRKQKEWFERNRDKYEREFLSKLNQEPQFPPNWRMDNVGAARLRTVCEIAWSLNLNVSVRDEYGKTVWQIDWLNKEQASVFLADYVNSLETIGLHLEVGGVVVKKFVMKEGVNQ